MMLSRQIGRSRRIPNVRPFRPPSGTKTAPSSRFFTGRQRLNLQSPHLRPQILYLSQPVFQGPLQKHINRLLSTDTRKTIRNGAILTTKAAAIAAALIICAGMVFWGVSIEKSERQKRTPEEWKFLWQDSLRRGRALLEEADNGGVVSWANVGSRFGRLVIWLETDGSKNNKITALGKDGTPAVVEEEAPTAFDISAMSYQWKSGYFEVIMGCAAAAEHLANSVLDTTRGYVFPRDVMIGPSNPDPRPTPPYMPPAPLEENCQQAYADAEIFYLRILVGIGFTTQQRLQAARAYANWLEYKGLNETAEEVYKWGVDIAKSAVSVPPETIMDPKTSVLNEDANTYATSNLLRATTDLAAYYARSGNVSTALPILLSILRARRTALVSPMAAEENARATQELNEVNEKPASFFTLLQTVSKLPPYPPPPPSGDTPFVRHSQRLTCDESELMLYIGEILFTTSPQSKEGLAWTREGVNIANENLEALEKAYNKAPRTIADLFLPDQTPEERKMEMERCKDCLLTGVTNWEVMLQRLAVQKSEAAAASSNSGWLGWFGRKDDGSAHIEDELLQVAALKDKILREGIAKEMFAIKGQVGGGTWIG